MRQIELALRAGGWSARRLSLEVTGSEDYIRSLGQVDEGRLEEALVTPRELLEEGGFELGSGAHSRVVAAVYDLLGQDRSPTTAARLRRLVTGLADPKSQ